MISKVELRKELEKRYSEFSEEELFDSYAFNELLQSFVTSMCYEKNRVPQVSVSYYPGSSETACTDGLQVYINAGHELIGAMSDLWAKYVSTVGFATHEAGHVLFTDFVVGKKQLQAWSQCAWFPNCRTTKSLKDLSASRLRLFLGEARSVQNILEDLYIENCLYAEFGGLATLGLSQLNNVMFEKSPSVEENLLAMANGNITPETIVMQALLNRKTGHPVKRDPSIAIPALLHPVLDEILNCYGDISKIVDDFEYETSPMKRASLIQNVVIRLLDLVPTEKEEQQMQNDSSNNSRNQQQSHGKKSNQSSGGKNSGQCNQNQNGEESGNQSSQNGQDSDGNSSAQSTSYGNNSEENSDGNSGSNNASSSQQTGSNSSDGSGDSDEQDSSEQASNSSSSEGSSKAQQARPMTASEAERVLEKIKEKLEESGLTREAKGNTRAVNSELTSEEKKENAEDQRSVSEQNLENRNSMEALLKKAIKDVIKAEMEANEETEQELELEREAMEMPHRLFPDRRLSDIPSFQVKVNSVTPAIKREYNRLYAMQKTNADHLYRKLNNVLTDRAVETSDSGYLMGTRFNAKDVWHGDGAYFSRPNVPDGKPDVVFGILCDESGSMSAYSSDGHRRRDEVVRDTAIMLEDVLHRLDVPTCIVGHTTSGFNIKIHPYIDFDKRNENDRYRLSSISSHNSNIDGGAITYISERLITRPERNKILIVISDGQPCYGSYYDENPVQDTKMAIAKYRKSGLKIIGAMLVEDKEASDIYGEKDFFDCTSPGSLEKELVKIVKKYVLI